MLLTEDLHSKHEVEVPLREGSGSRTSAWVTDRGLSKREATLLTAMLHYL
jgi:hypothetical protein